MKRHLLPTLLLATLIPTAAVAETRYITDEFEVTMRSGTSTSNSIVRMLRSGETVTVLEEDLASQYSLVETDDNKKGYVLTRFLMDRPSARQSLSELQVGYAQQQQKLDEQGNQIADLEQALNREQSDNKALKTTLRASELELTEVRNAASDTLNIQEQNQRLQAVVEQLREEKLLLTDKNAELSDTTRLDWFVRGGAVSLIAFVVGILVTRIRWRKQDSWGSY